ncbi:MULTISPECIES: MarR family winged helix-turn-helix transcriptional regulator [Paraburkholderia]|uniref:DNA-binding MarR family transcriptional regulator n=1 Tax=Paraburkholderia youngii TaxID=2782701 RepID=A0A7W8P8S6_9BURK|nr:MarR family transcriptional regulator [Paraburkholderia youngii]MBB5404507.1 DNA-binding MarR family transcriptional regulator [Paraburkholderia youngii]NVH75164.1 MarR family transcriptional regulator [Paraburkholderia youngii]
MSKSPLPVTPEELHTLAEDLRVLVGKLRRRLREESHVGDFTPSQVQVLNLLEREGPATVTALARAHGMRPQSMGETLAALKAAGLVNGAPDPNDGRQTVLSLTPSFRKKVKASRAAREDWLYRTIQTRFTQAEQQQLATGVDLLKRLVDL